MPIRIDDYQRQRRAGFGPFLHNADPLVRLDWYLQGLSNFHTKTKKLCNHYRTYLSNLIDFPFQNNFSLQIVDPYIPVL